MDRNGWTAFDEAEPHESDCLDGWLLVWHVYRHNVSVRWEDRRHTSMITHWMPMPKEGWISASDRKPTKKDADIMGCVLAINRYDGIRVTGWFQFDLNCYLTHWRPTPGHPEDHMEYSRRF